MADTSAGFRYRGRRCGGQPTVQDFVATSAATYHKGDMLSANSGEVEIAATDAAVPFLGVCLETAVCDGTATTGTKVKCIVNEDAIYGVYDANARVKGAKLDVSGATSAMTVATDSNHDFIVYAPSAATEETLVCFNHGVHLDAVTKA
jgi:hypothetical protein